MSAGAVRHGLHPQQQEQEREQEQQGTELRTWVHSSNPAGGAPAGSVMSHGGGNGSYGGCEYDSDLDEQLEPPEYEAGYCYRRGDRVVWRGLHYVCRLSHQAPEGGPLEPVEVEEQEREEQAGGHGEGVLREEGRGVVEGEGRRRGGCDGGSGGHVGRGMEAEGAETGAGLAARAAVRRRVCWEQVEQQGQPLSSTGGVGASGGPLRSEAPAPSTPSAGCPPGSQSHPPLPAQPSCCCADGGAGAAQEPCAGRESHAGQPLPHFGLAALGGPGSADDGDPSAGEGEGDWGADGGGKGQATAVERPQRTAAGHPPSVGGVRAVVETPALAAAAPAPAAASASAVADGHTSGHSHSSGGAAALCSGGGSVGGAPVGAVGAGGVGAAAHRRTPSGRVQAYFEEHLSSLVQLGHRRQPSGGGEARLPPSVRPREE